MTGIGATAAASLPWHRTTPTATTQFIKSTTKVHREREREREALMKFSLLQQKAQNFPIAYQDEF